jgi:hypothetical protein
MKQFGKILASLVAVAVGCVILPAAAHAGNSYGFSFGYNSGGGCAPAYYGGAFNSWGGCAPRYYGGVSYSYSSRGVPPAYYYRPANVSYYAPPVVSYAPPVCYPSGPTVVYRPYCPPPTYFYSGGSYIRY